MQTSKTVDTVERERESRTLNKRVVLFACTINEYKKIEDSFKIHTSKYVF